MPGEKVTATERNSNLGYCSRSCFIVVLRWSSSRETMTTLRPWEASLKDRLPKRSIVLE